MKKFTFLGVSILLCSLSFGQMVCNPISPNIISNCSFDITDYQLPIPSSTRMGNHVCAWDSAFGITFYYKSTTTPAYVTLLSTVCAQTLDAFTPAGVSQAVNIIEGQKFNLDIEVNMFPTAKKSNYDSIEMDSIIVCFTNANKYFSMDVQGLDCQSRFFGFSKRIILDTSHLWMPVSQSPLHRHYYKNNIVADSNYNKLLIYAIPTPVDANEGFCAKTNIFSIKLDLINPFGAFAGRDSTICRHQPVRLGGHPCVWGGVAPYTYSWTSIPSGFTSNDPNPLVSPVQTTNYILEVQAHDAQNNQITTSDTVIITINQGCLWPHWPEMVTNPYDYSLMPDDMTSDIDGNVTIFFYHSLSGPVSIGFDTTFPYFPGNVSIASFDKSGQLLWHNCLDDQLGYWPEHPQTDSAGNIYFLFRTPDYFSFYSGESGSIGTWGQIFVKMNKAGVIQWTQHFYNKIGYWDAMPIKNFCIRGNYIFLYGISNGPTTIGNYDLTQDGEFLCKLNSFNGDLDLPNLFSNDIKDGRSIVSSNNNLIINEGQNFFLFDTNCNLISTQVINNFSTSILTENGSSQFIASNRDKVISMYLDNSNNVQVRWTKSYPFGSPSSLFTTNEYIYFNIYDSIFKLDQYGRCHFKILNSKDGVCRTFMTGHSNLDYGYTLGNHKGMLGDTLVLDTIYFGRGTLGPVHIDSTQSVSEENNNFFNIYPNPSDGILNIDIENPTSGVVELINSYGIILNRILIVNGKSLYKFDLSEFQSGIYLILCSSPDGSSIKKLIKK